MFDEGGRVPHFIVVPYRQLIIVPLYKISCEKSPARSPAEFLNYPKLGRWAENLYLVINILFQAYQEAFYIATRTFHI
jgi:predicted ATPase